MSRRTRETTNFSAEAKSDALDMIENFAEEITRQLIEDGEASDDFLNDYPNGDSYHHENHTDKAYSLSEAAQLLDDLDEFEETDEGLWEGQSPRDAISTQAAYTYANAVYSMACDTIKDINQDEEIADLLNDHQEIDEAMDNSQVDPATAKIAQESFKASIADRLKAIIATAR